MQTKPGIHLCECQVARMIKNKDPHAHCLWLKTWSVEWQVQCFLWVGREKSSLSRKRVSCSNVSFGSTTCIRKQSEILGVLGSLQYQVRNWLLWKYVFACVILTITDSSVPTRYLSVLPEGLCSGRDYLIRTHNGVVSKSVLSSKGLSLLNALIQSSSEHSKRKMRLSPPQRLPVCGLLA